MLLIGTDEGIYRWTEGNNWAVFHGLQDRAVVGLASPGAGFLAALDAQGHLWESGNNGQTWREVTLPEGVDRPSAMIVGGTPASILIASKGASIYRRMLGTANRSVSVIERAKLAGPVLVNRAKAIVASRGKLATATAVSPSKRAPNLNGWTKLGAPKLTNTALDIVSMLATPTTWYVAVAGEGLWRSSDGGAGWSRIAGLPKSVQSVIAVPGRPGHLIAATSDGVWSSGDDGQTWEDRSKGLDAVKHVRAIEACPNEPDYLLAGAAPLAGSGPQAVPRDGLGYGLYESKDGGKSWAKVLRSFPDNLQFDAIADIKFDPAEPDHAAVAFESGEMWMTLNGGDYWQPFSRDIRSARVLRGIA